MTSRAPDRPLKFAGQSLVELLEAEFDEARQDVDSDINGDPYDNGFLDGLAHGLAIAIGIIREPYVYPPDLGKVYAASELRTPAVEEV